MLEGRLLRETVSYGVLHGEPQIPNAARAALSVRGALGELKEHGVLHVLAEQLEAGTCSVDEVMELLRAAPAGAPGRGSELAAAACVFAMQKLAQLRRYAEEEPDSDDDDGADELLQLSELLHGSGMARRHRLWVVESGLGMFFSAGERSGRGADTLPLLRRLLPVLRAGLKPDLIPAGSEEEQADEEEAEREQRVRGVLAEVEQRLSTALQLQARGLVREECGPQEEGGGLSSLSPPPHALRLLLLPSPGLRQARLALALQAAFARLLGALEQRSASANDSASDSVVSRQQEVAEDEEDEAAVFCCALSEQLLQSLRAAVADAESAGAAAAAEPPIQEHRARTERELLEQTSLLLGDAAMTAPGASVTPALCSALLRAARARLAEADAIAFAPSGGARSDEEERFFTQCGELYTRLSSMAETLPALRLPSLSAALEPAERLPRDAEQMRAEAALRDEEQAAWAAAREELSAPQRREEKGQQGAAAATEPAAGLQELLQRLASVASRREANRRAVRRGGLDSLAPPPQRGPLSNELTTASPERAEVILDGAPGYTAAMLSYAHALAALLITHGELPPSAAAIAALALPLARSRALLRRLIRGNHADAPPLAELLGTDIAAVLYGDAAAAVARLEPSTTVAGPELRQQQQVEAAQAALQQLQQRSADLPLDAVAAVLLGRAPAARAACAPHLIGGGDGAAAEAGPLRRWAARRLRLAEQLEALRGREMLSPPPSPPRDAGRGGQPKDEEACGAAEADAFDRSMSLEERPDEAEAFRHASCGHSADKAAQAAALADEWTDGGASDAMLLALAHSHAKAAEWADALGAVLRLTRPEAAAELVLRWLHRWGTADAEEALWHAECLLAASADGEHMLYKRTVAKLSSRLRTYRAAFGYCAALRERCGGGERWHELDRACQAEPAAVIGELLRRAEGEEGGLGSGGSSGGCFGVARELATQHEAAELIDGVDQDELLWTLRTRGAVAALPLLDRLGGAAFGVVSRLDERLQVFTTVGDGAAEQRAMTAVRLFLVQWMARQVQLAEKQQRAGDGSAPARSAAAGPPPHAVPGKFLGDARFSSQALEALQLGLRVLQLLPPRWQEALSELCGRPQLMLENLLMAQEVEVCQELAARLPDLAVDELAFRHARLALDWNVGSSVEPPTSLEIDVKADYFESKREPLHLRGTTTRAPDDWVHEAPLSPRSRQSRLAPAAVRGWLDLETRDLTRERHWAVVRPGALTLYDAEDEAASGVVAAIELDELKLSEPKKPREWLGAHQMTLRFAMQPGLQRTASGPSSGPLSPTRGGRGRLQEEPGPADAPPQLSGGGDWSSPPDSALTLGQRQRNEIDKLTLGLASDEEKQRWRFALVECAAASSSDRRRASSASSGGGFGGAAGSAPEASAALLDAPAMASVSAAMGESGRGGGGGSGSGDERTSSGRLGLGLGSERLLVVHGLDDSADAAARAAFRYPRSPNLMLARRLLDVARSALRAGRVCLSMCEELSRRVARTQSGALAIKANALLSALLQHAQRLFSSAAEDEHELDTTLHSTSSAFARVDSLGGGALGSLSGAARAALSGVEHCQTLLSQVAMLESLLQSNLGFRVSLADLTQASFLNADLSTAPALLPRAPPH